MTNDQVLAGDRARYRGGPGAVLTILLPVMLFAGDSSLAHAQAAASDSSAAAASQAAAASFPVRLLDRPTTLPKGALRFDAYAIGSETPGAPYGVTGIVGGGWGVTNRLEIGGQVVPVVLAPDVQYTNPSVYATYQYALGSSAALAPTLQAVLPVRAGDPFVVDAGAALTVNIGRWGYVGATPMLSLNLHQDGNGSTLSLPVTLVRQAGARFNWQVSTGVGFSRFEPRFGLGRRFDPLDFDDVTFAAGGLVMYTLPRAGTGNALADLSLQVQWPQLYARGPGEAGWATNDWTVQLQSSWYIMKAPRSSVGRTSARVRNE